MKTNVIHFAIALLISTTVCNAATIITGPIQNPGNLHYYYLISGGTWSEAESFSLTLGGHLTSIGSAAEQNWVVTTFSAYGATDRNLWIGLSDSVQEGSFQWINGESVNYTNWASGQPSNSTADRDFTAILAAKNKLGLPAGTWITLQDSNVNFATLNPVFGVAEVVPEPSAVCLLLLSTSLLLGVRSRCDKQMPNKA